MNARYVMVDPFDLLTGEMIDTNEYTRIGPWVPIRELPIRTQDDVRNSKTVILQMKIGEKTIETPGWYNYDEQVWYVLGLYKNGNIINWAEVEA